MRTAFLAARSPGLTCAVGAAVLLCGLVARHAAHAAPAEVALPAAPPVALGALFYTPAQRQRISQARRGAGAADDTAATGAVRLDGLIRHGRGTATAFINGQEAGAHLASTGAALSIESQGVRLDAHTRLVVGQSVVPGAGNAPQDLVPAGSVVSGRAPVDSAPAPGALRLQRSRATVGQP